MCDLILFGLVKIFKINVALDAFGAALLYYEIRRPYNSPSRLTKIDQTNNK